MVPVLYSFRRCPYAMRLRLALVACSHRVELREVILRDKPAEFLEVSPSATVPCLQSNGGWIDESLDAMQFVLSVNDPEGWLDMPQSGHDWIVRADGPFKDALDRTKYATRYPSVDVSVERAKACAFLADLDEQIAEWIFDKPTLADYAILPFVRQFAFVDKAWFDAQPWPNVQAWLERFLESEPFAAIMQKYPQWRSGEPGVAFP